MICLDLHDWQVGSLCSLCGTTSEQPVAEFRDPDAGPVCSECLIDLLRAGRVLRDSMKGVLK